MRMKELRIKRNLSQKEIAAQLGMPVRRYGSYEREERTLSLVDAARIADVFECTLDELAGREWPQQGLSADESKLVDCYRRTDESDRPTLLATASTMAFAGDAKKESHQPAPRLAHENVK